MVKPETRPSFSAPHGAGLATSNSSPNFVRLCIAPTGLTVLTVDPKHDFGAVLATAAQLICDPALVSADSAWAKTGLLLLQNMVPESVNLAAARNARRIGIPVMLNAFPFRGLGPDFASLVDILVVNAVEAEKMGAPRVTDLNSAAIAAETLAARFSAVVVTAGSCGLAAWSAMDEAFCMPAEKVEIVCRQGVGDAFTGALATAIAGGHLLQTACEIASSAATRHLSGAGGQPARKSLELVSVEKIDVL